MKNRGFPALHISFMPRSCRFDFAEQMDDRCVGNLFSKIWDESYIDFSVPLRKKLIGECSGPRSGDAGTGFFAVGGAFTWLDVDISYLKIFFFSLAMCWKVTIF